MFEAVKASSASSLNNDTTVVADEFCVQKCTYDASYFCLVSTPGMGPKYQISSQNICNEVLQLLQDFAKDLESKHVIGAFSSEPRKARGYCRPLFNKINEKCTKARMECENLSIVFSICSSRYSLFAKSGADNCIVFDIKGNPFFVIDEAINNSDAKDDNELCGFTYTVIDSFKTPIISAFGCSEGFIDSFANNESIYCYLRELIIFASKNNAEILSDYLAKNFGSIPKDKQIATITGFIDNDFTSDFVKPFKRLNYTSTTKMKLAKVEEKLTELNNTDVDKLKKQAEAAKKNYKIAFAEYDKAQADFDAVLDRSGKQSILAILHNKFVGPEEKLLNRQNAEKNLEKAESKMNAALTSFEDARTELEDFESRKQELLDKKRRLNHNLRIHKY